MPVKSAISSRRAAAKESFKTASECIGEIHNNMSLFAITRGQFSMIDAVLACLDQTKTPASISLWTWTIAEYEIECMQRLMADKRLKQGRLIIDSGARKKNIELINQWRSSFGSNSVKYVVNHAKIATIETDEYKLLLRGSMNLNFNARFEQFDITEGGEDFYLVKEIENELPFLPDNCSNSDSYKASKVSEAFNPEQLSIFTGAKVWAK